MARTMQDVDSIILSRREYEDLTGALQDAQDEVSALMNAIVGQGPLAQRAILEHLTTRSHTTPDVTVAAACRALVTTLEDLTQPPGGAA